jgi:hypothetical protein
MAGWWYTYPSRQMGFLFPTEWKVMKLYKIHLPNHQAVSEFRNSAAKNEWAIYNL